MCEAPAAALPCAELPGALRARCGWSGRHSRAPGQNENRSMASERFGRWGLRTHRQWVRRIPGRLGFRLRTAANRAAVPTMSFFFPEQAPIAVPGASLPLTCDIQADYRRSRCHWRVTLGMIAGFAEAGRQLSGQRLAEGRDGLRRVAVEALAKWRACSPSP